MMLSGRGEQDIRAVLLQWLR
ncbi:hypothetical protein CURTO8I2_70339 [Curtobacterium sp. 8I-2]|nr:hypothetical protein CURTO8I2_70339 [Curtobacterium sp. 8I-2]